MDDESSAGHQVGIHDFSYLTHAQLKTTFEATYVNCPDLD